MQTLTLHENSALFKPYGEGTKQSQCRSLIAAGNAPVDSTKYRTLHDFVLACGGNTPELQTALMVRPALADDL